MNRREVIASGAASLLLSTAASGRQIRPVGTARTVVDPRIELISFVHLLGGYFLLGEASTTYKIEASKYFAPYREHPVVKMAMLLSKDTLSFDAVPDLMLRLTDPDALTWRNDLAVGIPPGIPDASTRSTFLGHLRDFARVSGFQRFFARHASLYRQVTDTIDPMVAPNVRALEAYAGSSLGAWKVIAGLLLNDGGFGPRLTRKDGALEAYAVIGPDWKSVGDPDFRNYDRLQDFVVHEFAHSLVNPITEKHPDIVQQYLARFNPMRAAMKKVGDYTTWPIVVNEHVVRAVTARIAGLRFGAPAGEAAVAKEVARGFTYVPALVDRLQRYESNRQRWPNLDSYYRQLMTAFEAT